MLRAVTRIPVIIATARDDEGEIIRLLHAGADDYLVKPYSAAHLAARIAAVLRRTGAGAAPSVLRVGESGDRPAPPAGAARRPAAGSEPA